MVVYDNETKVMLTGDATIDNELEVINNYDSDELDADILKLGHHGSNTSTSLEFLNAVNPKYAVVSANKKNDNHPNPVVLENIMEYNNHSQNDIELKQTGSLGNIIFYTNDSENIEMLNIANVDDYLFLSWWVVVLSFAVIVGISIFSTDFVRLIFSRHKTAVKY
jgi:beta-lactamase superfamily II metal-dependent hydrolase